MAYFNVIKYTKDREMVTNITYKDTRFTTIYSDLRICIKLILSNNEAEGGLIQVGLCISLYILNPARILVKFSESVLFIWYMDVLKVS